MSNAFPWFEPHLYASIDECDKLPKQCIAPTVRMRRCLVKINYRDLSEALTLRLEAQSLSDCQERNQAIEGYVLLHCCDENHRHKLAGDSDSLGSSRRATVKRSA